MIKILGSFLFLLTLQNTLYHVGLSLGQFWHTSTYVTAQSYWVTLLRCLFFFYLGYASNPYSWFHLECLWSKLLLWVMTVHSCYLKYGETQHAWNMYKKNNFFQVAFKTWWRNRGCHILNYEVWNWGWNMKRRLVFGSCTLVDGDVFYNQ